MTSGTTGTDLVVLGVSVVGDEIASVVRRAGAAAAGDAIIASNIVDLPDASPAAAAAAIRELVESVPFTVDETTIVCAEPGTREHLASVLRPHPNSPLWLATVEITDFSAAMAAVARTRPSDAVTAVVNLDRHGAPALGTCVALIDQTTGEVLGTASNPGASNPGADSAASTAPVTDPQGAAAVAAMVARTTGGTAVAAVICTGAGAQLPGIVPALEYAMERPVSVAELPALALAAGAAAPTPMATLVPVPARPRNLTGLRWWALGGVIGLAVVLGAIALTAMFAGSRAAAPSTVAPSTETVTVTRAPVTVMRSPRTRIQIQTQTVTEAKVETTTVTPPTVTRTEEATVTETAAETDTVTETTTETVQFPGGPVVGGASNSGG
ncbi:MAG: hypothetical protein QM673_07285 [Gordonia sp. (in: high G+C Gram-positive bacteria)]